MILMPGEGPVALISVGQSIMVRVQRSRVETAYQTAMQGNSSSVYREIVSSLYLSPIGSRSISSASSSSGGPPEGFVGDQHLADNDSKTRNATQNDRSYHQALSPNNAATTIRGALPLHQAVVAKHAGSATVSHRSGQAYATI